MIVTKNIARYLGSIANCFMPELLTSLCSKRHINTLNTRRSEVVAFILESKLGNIHCLSLIASLRSILKLTKTVWPLYLKCYKVLQCKGVTDEFLFSFGL